MPDDRGNPTAEEVLDAWLARLAVLEADARKLRCAECGASDDGERGWTLRLDVDGELAAFCPACDEREFGDA